MAGMSVWKKVLETAVYAPSLHNVQPWRLRILSDQAADLLIEKRRDEIVEWFRFSDRSARETARKNVKTSSVFCNSTTS